MDLEHRSLRMVGAAGRELVVTVDASTTVFIEGRRASALELRRGETLRVLYDATPGGLTATWVEPGREQITNVRGGN